MRYVNVFRTSLRFTPRRRTDPRRRRFLLRHRGRTMVSEEPPEFENRKPRVCYLTRGPRPKDESAVVPSASCPPEDCARVRPRVFVPHTARPPSAPAHVSVCRRFSSDFRGKQNRTRSVRLTQSARPDTNASAVLYRIPVTTSRGDYPGGGTGAI